MITSILEFGADPNDEHDGTTPWMEALLYLIRTYKHKAREDDMTLSRTQAIM
jgi:hypothetical protein